MLKYVNHDIVFQEFPDEVTLAINLSLCPTYAFGKCIIRHNNSVPTVVPVATAATWQAT